MHLCKGSFRRSLESKRKVNYMKIALINNHHEIAGAGRYAFTLAEYLADYVALDHYLFNKDDYTLELVDSKKGYKLLKQLKKRILFDNFLFNKARLSNIFLDWRLASFIPSDYLIYHFTGNTLTKLVYHPNIEGKIIITAHDLFYLTAPENRMERFFSKCFLYTGISKADSIIAISEYTKSEILKHFKNITSNSIIFIIL